MCTAIIVRHGAGPAATATVAANRDEYYQRPARAPVVLSDRPRVVGGLDLAAGGSWFGVTEAGFLALITNQPEPGGPLPDRRSRGELVAEVLRRGDPAAARAWLADQDGRDYNSFNLLFGDAGGLEVIYGRSTSSRLEIEAVPDGLSVLPNGRLDEPNRPKVARARALAEPSIDTPWPELGDVLRRALADHHRPPLSDVPEPAAGARFSRDIVRELHALCIHTPVYGTRSSAVIRLEPGRPAAFLHADGPPCVTAFVDAMTLLKT